MELRERLQTDIKDAMRSGDIERRDTLRMLTAAIKQVEIDERVTLDSEGIQGVLATQAKRRRESIADYEKANRPDLAEQERKELIIIETYLPKMMDADELRPIVADAIAKLGVTDLSGMGRVMGTLMPQLKGQADGRLINQIVREALQSN